MEDGPCGARTVDLCLDVSRVIIIGFCLVFSNSSAGGALLKMLLRAPLCVSEPAFAREWSYDCLIGSLPSLLAWLDLFKFCSTDGRISVSFEGVGESSISRSMPRGMDWLMILSSAGPHIDS